MSSGMNLEQAIEYAKTMTYSEAVHNVKYGKFIKYRKATMVKLRELAEIADTIDEQNCVVVPREDVERKRGEWIVYPLMDEGRVELECPICGDTFIRAVDYKPHFCENCGAKMKGVE